MYHKGYNRCHNGCAEDRGLNTNHDGNDTRTVQRRRDVLLVLRREYQKAYARTEGVEDVDVSLAHEEVLVQYDDAILSEVKVKDTPAIRVHPSVTRIRQKAIRATAG